MNPRVADVGKVEREADGQAEVGLGDGGANQVLVRLDFKSGKLVASVAQW